MERQRNKWIVGGLASLALIIGHLLFREQANSGRWLSGCL
jgi:hypothetical protein